MKWLAGGFCSYQPSYQASPCLLAEVQLSCQYSTDGVVKLNIMNVTFVTKELRVVLLGCDLGYFDNYLLFPPTPSWQTQVTPFSCLECNCEVFESLRTESFVAVNA
jgi:hypothetical protein